MFLPKNFKKITVAFSLLLIVNALCAGGKFEMTAQARLAYDKTLALKFDEANVILAQVKKMTLKTSLRTTSKAISSV
ncbi:MAG: hypothetical protein HC817_13310 [Saprospiraceae bacterium]|nr:hypothetical protein [Saprospiraceae bacterium]